MHKKSTFIAALVGDSVDGSDRLRASAQEGIRHHRLDRRLGGDLRLVFRVADRLGLAGAAEEPDTEQADQDDSGQAARDVPDEDLPDRALPSAPAHHREFALLSAFQAR